MLSPKKVKYRKQMKGNMRGTAYRGSTIKPGRILYELTGVEEELAVKALKLAGNKLPFATKVISRRTTI
jgi:ribosomal protein L16/L10AE